MKIEPLKHKSPKTVVKEAREQVLQEKSGKQLGLMTRFPRLNIAVRKYFRFNTVNLFAGMSGSGKSYMLNNFTEDFLDYKEGGINFNIDFIPIVLHFCFEMSGYNEILRSCASDLGLSYNYILSSQYNKHTKEYNVLTDEEFKKIDNYLKYYENKTIYFFENAGNTEEIKTTVLKFFAICNSSTLKTGKEHKLIINIDHTLLIETGMAKDAVDLMSKVAKLAIFIRKTTGAMVNLIGQLNNNIENPIRLTNPALQYPQKSDIYAQGQLYNACDSVFTWHRPELLKLSKYGRKELPTKNLFHLLALKARHGNVGSIWFEDNLKKGRIVEKQKQDEEEINLEDEEENFIPEV